MFGRQKTQIDIKKSTQKLLDTKKDVPTRLKHLKLILDYVEIYEAKILFSSHYSAIYQLVYEGIISAEQALKTRGVHRAQREELECALLLLEKVFILLPDLLHCRWQFHSISMLMLKLNHPGNSIRLRRESLRLFILWYQCLGTSASTSVDKLFASLIPDLLMSSERSPWAISSGNQDIEPLDNSPILPSTNDERQPEDTNSYLFECLLDFIVSQVSKILWNDGAAMWAKSFNFLYERLKIFYIPRIFPNYFIKMDIYNPVLELPEPRYNTDYSNNPTINCQVIFIKWISNYVHSVYRSADQFSPNDMQHHEERNPYDDVDVNIIAKNIILGSRENINHLHEIFRRALHLNFSQSAAVRRVVCVYKDWIQMNVPELPIFMLEPEESDTDNNEANTMKNHEEKSKSYCDSLAYMNNNRIEYISHLRAGSQQLLRVFFCNSASVFLLFHTPKNETSENSFIEEQVDICKRVLNIYRYAVMNVRMDNFTWEQLLIVMLHITQKVLDKSLPRNFLKHSETLGYKLSAALFQTLIVSWVKASLNVPISIELWDQIETVLADLISNELIVEWSKTMETLTRVLSKHVYNLDLTNLPLERLSEQKSKKLRGNRRSETFIKDDYKSFSSTDGPESMKSTADPDKIFQKCKKDNQDGKSLILPASAAMKLRKTLTHQRSISEGNIFKVTHRSHHRHHANSEISSTSSAEHHDDIKYKRKKSKSLSSIGNVSQFEGHAPSSVQGTSDWAEISSSTASLDNSSAIHNMDDHEYTSSSSKHEITGVIAGGKIKGWLPSVSWILWKRMLGILGDVNNFSNPETFTQFYQVLTTIWLTLYKIRENQGVSVDNISSPQPPRIVPPLTLILPWCLQSYDCKTDEFNKGKVLSIALLSNITLVNQDVAFNHEYLCKFYSIIHKIINSKNQELTNELVKNLGLRFTSKMLSGFSMLFLNFVQASHSVLSRSDLKKSPRNEASCLLGSILLISELCKDLPQLKPNTLQFQPVSSLQTKDVVISCLIKYAKIEPTAQARCIILQSLSIYLCKLLVKIKHNDGKKPENAVQDNQIIQIIQLLCESVKINAKSVALVSSDILQVLSEFSNELVAHFPSICSHIFLSLRIALQQAIPLKGKSWSFGKPFETEKRFIISIIYTLGEWCMRLPLETLLNILCIPNPNNGDSLKGTILDSIFEVLNKLINGHQRSTTDEQAFIEGFDSNIPFDDLQSVDSSNEKDQGDFHCLDTIKIAASNLVQTLMTQLGHFPVNYSSRCGSMISENDDMPGISENEELNSSIFTLPNLQMFALEPQNLMSISRLPSDSVDMTESSSYLNQTRVIVRNCSGKFTWDFTPLILPSDDEHDSHDMHLYEPPIEDIYPSAFTGNFTGNFPQLQSNKPRLNIRKRPAGLLPTLENTNQDMDNLDDLLGYISYTSPECLQRTNNEQLDEQLVSLSKEHEDDIIGTVVNQRNIEAEFMRRFDHDFMLRSSPISRSIDSPIEHESCSKDIEVCYPKDYIKHSSSIGMTNFFHCRRLFSLLGYNNWEERQNILLLNKDERLLRELKNLDSQKCREVHKIAVIYIAQGQEDKQSILFNNGGSEQFEEFVAGLGWEVELESHTGFMGGLNRNKSSGETAPYYATSLIEVMFHVSTRLPSNTEESLLNKTRHLGNDEVQIVWSEHTRDYRRDIIPTEFCDVLIVIYPLNFDLYRIQISRKKEVPYFGPLYNECIVGRSVLPILVRATAINASRAKRSSIKLYHHFFEERSKSLSNVIKSHKIRTTFEDFSANIFSPKQPSSTQSQSSGKFDSGLIDSSLNYNSWSKNSRESPAHAQNYESASVPQSPVPPIAPKRMSLKGLKQRPSAASTSASFSSVK